MVFSVDNFIDLFVVVCGFANCSDEICSLEMHVEAWLQNRRQLTSERSNQKIRIEMVVVDFDLLLFLDAV